FEMRSIITNISTKKPPSRLAFSIASPRSQPELKQLVILDDLRIHEASDRKLDYPFTGFSKRRGRHSLFACTATICEGPEPHIPGNTGNHPLPAVPPAQ